MRARTGMNEDRPLVAGRFEILELAGSGGMGHVFRARDHASGREVALKRLDLSGSELLSRFDHEARLLASIDHPSIVRYVAHGVDEDGTPYLVTEWVEGEDLARRLARDPPTLEESVRLAALLARALGYLHARGVVHRDVKPGNVHLSGARFESPRLLDFGIARSIESPRHLTRTGTAMGTPAYMAPEQARGSRAIDARSDVFALG